MKKILVAGAACALMIMPARAEPLPTLSKFLSECYRDTTTCRAKMRDYVIAGDTQKSFCRPKDQSVSSGVSDMLSWLRDSEKHPELSTQPYDDGFWAAASTLWKCEDPAAEPASVPEQPSDTQQQG